MRNCKAYRLKNELCIAVSRPAPDYIHFYKNELVEGEITENGNNLIVRNNDVEEKNGLMLPTKDLEEQQPQTFEPAFIDNSDTGDNPKIAASYMWGTLVKPTVKILYEQDPKSVKEWLNSLIKELGINVVGVTLKEDDEKLQKFLKSTNIDVFSKPYNIEVGGNHYQKPIQPWDYIYANGLGFDEGCIVKYATRHKDKGKAEDIKKIISYCKHILKTQYNDDGEV
jgi:hypothetical protein